MTTRMRRMLPHLFMVLLCILVSSSYIDAQARDWNAARTLATNFVTPLSQAQKLTLIRGTGCCKKCAYQIAAVGSFPGLCLEDGPLGLRVLRNVTAFPSGINAAATWNRSAIYQRGRAIGEEFYTRGINVHLGPYLNLARFPGGGRNWEGFGGDPYLAGEATYENILGIQSTKVMASAKHMVGNEQQNYQYTASSAIDDRTMHEVYGWPFLRAVQANISSIMCSLNRVNNQYACGSSYLLNTVLRDHYKFQGFIVSDWNGCHLSGDKSFAVQKNVRL
eukprot:TRINITY_DN1548_c0_g1_i1.p1 TRINITY_DN1548_c0_g1~~TRINITY_DN1548_c0_g1_i1.p1  ORF type:complete len:277 (-),score=36.09 TRINITY_DN1548_c0_g1_i1:89-919(-)